MDDNSPYDAWRQNMVEEIAIHAQYTSAQIGKDALSERIMEAMGAVPRHKFVPVELMPYAYFNRPLPIGYVKTISQPFIVALMTELLEVSDGDTVLEVGTGLGYQAAVLSALAKQVYSMEIIEELEADAKKRLQRLGYANTETRLGNGYYGWPEHAPFDGIIVTAAPDLIPPSLITQLRPGGRMVIPAGGSLETQQLLLVEKDQNGKIETKEVLPVRFMELVGENGIEDD